jgi:guanosine-3',5'-bis(diphosphate) 3'-pyrophosphohydrolase
MSDLAKFTDAALFAAKKHRYQTRKGNDGEPYINHPLEVAHLLISVGGVEDIDILLGGILHDTIEDTETTEGEITQLFGSRVCGYVLEVTDDKSLPKAERKQKQVEHAPHLSHGAKQIKLCDKISNIRDVIENPAIDWSDERRREYVEWGERVVAGLRGANPALEEYFDKLVERAKSDLSVPSAVAGGSS